MITNHKFVAWDGLSKCLACGGDKTDHEQLSPLVTNSAFLMYSTPKERDDLVNLQKLKMLGQQLEDTEKKLKDTNARIDAAKKKTSEIDTAIDKYMDSSKKTDDALGELQTKLIIFSVACFALAAFMIARIFIFRI